MFLRRVRGASMTPALVDGDIVIVGRRKARVDDIVIAKREGNEIIKRVKAVENDGYYLVGDNGSESTDSRHFGKIANEDILGTIMIVLPQAIAPPKLVKPYGLWLGRVLALVLVGFALVHLFRIDTFLPILDQILPGGSSFATFVGLVIILSEIFAVPFALRMKLSLLAHIKSGALIVFAPLWWLLITIWAFGSPESTGQLGEFVSTPATVWLLLVNILWVAVSYGALYTLGYNRLSVKALLRKK